MQTKRPESVHRLLGRGFIHAHVTQRSIKELSDEKGTGGGRLASQSTERQRRAPFQKGLGRDLRKILLRQNAQNVASNICLEVRWRPHEWLTITLSSRAASECEPAVCSNVLLGRRILSRDDGNRIKGFQRHGLVAY